MAFSPHLIDLGLQRGEAPFPAKPKAQCLIQLRARHLFSDPQIPAPQAPARHLAPRCRNARWVSLSAFSSTHACRAACAYRPTPFSPFPLNIRSRGRLPGVNHYVFHLSKISPPEARAGERPRPAPAPAGAPFPPKKSCPGRQGDRTGALFRATVCEGGRNAREICIWQGN